MSKRTPRKTPPPATSPLLRFAPLLIVVAGFLAYANSLEGPFVFDDYRAIVDNSTIRDLSWTTVLHPQKQTPMAGRPLANLSLALNYALSGDSVVTYHLFNITVHTLAALALLGVLRRTPLWPDADRQTTNAVAVFAALAWLVHPLNTDAVDYVTQRTESMAGLFFLLTVYAAIRAREDASGWRWPAASVFACWCGVVTKELVVVAPIVVVLWDQLFAVPSLASARRRRAWLYGGLASSWLLFFVLSLDTPFFNPAGFEIQVSRWTYLANQAPLLARYLRLSVWPVGLVLDYGLARPLTAAQILPGALLVLGLLTATALALVRAPALGFWGAWFFITLAPASSIVPIPTEVGAERRMYLPLIAVIVVVVSLIRWTARRVPTMVNRSSAQIAAIVVLLLLITGTVARNREYRSGLAIWQTVVDRYPHARAHENLAVQLRDAGRVDEAIEHLRIAAPDLPDARHALGSALLERGDVPGGVSELQAFVEANPGDREIASAREELARGRTRLIGELIQAQRFADAEATARALVAERPRDATAHNLLGVALASEDQIDAAIREFQTALQIDPQAKEPRDNLARALAIVAQQGR